MTANAFDPLAGDYDRLFTASRVGSLQRGQVWEYLDAEVLGGKPLSVLELGAGTGEDAISFARRGHSVLATDQSAVMTAKAREKVVAAGTDRIAVERHDLRTLCEVDPGSTFDLVFSNFGALNCVSPTDLDQLAGDLSRRLAPSGRVILVVMGRFCLWETVYFFLKGRWKSAGRRWSGGPVTFEAGGASTRVWYFSSRALGHRFRPYFRCRTVRPIGLVVPPSYLETAFVRFPRLQRLAGCADRMFGGFAFAARFADHVLIDLERTETSVAAR